MNKQSFDEKVKESLNSSNKHSMYEMMRWYHQLLEMLEHSYFQKKTLKHPRHRGDSREYDLVELISKMLPDRMKINKGYCYDRNSGITHEQDCLIYDCYNYAPLMQTSEIAYLPIESVYSSIEIKSNLTLDELRKCVLNCLSLKKLSRSNEEKRLKVPIELESIEDKDKVIYSIFAYDTPYSNEKLIEVLEEANKEIPIDLQINMIYVLKKGLIIPARDDNSITLEFRDVLNHNGNYVAVTKLARRDDECLKVLPFLLFLSYIIDHFNDICKEREIVSYARYVFDQIMLQERIDRILGERNNNDV